MLSHRILRSTSSLKDRFQQLLPDMRDRITNLKKQHGKKVVDKVTICNIINGLRGVKALTCDTSKSDPIKGIYFRGLTLKECLNRLPNYAGHTIAAPEGMFWLLLTGEVPNCDQLENLSTELRQRAAIPEYSTQIINSLPKDLDALTQFSIGLMAIQPESRFDNAYNQGIRKTEYWEPTIEDALDLMAKLPTVAAMVHNNLYNSSPLPQWDDSLDWTGNFGKKLGVNDPIQQDLLRLYLLTFSDHEAGNITAHTTLNVGSALSDPYKSYAAGLCGLGGPLHVRGQQMALSFIQAVERDIGLNASEEQIKEFAQEWISSGRKIMGYGHKVLKSADSRFIALKDFADNNLADNQFYQLTQKVNKVIPEYLKNNITTKNYHPNSFAISGSLLSVMGIPDEFMTIMFGVSRSIGCTAQLVWSRATLMAIERPDSLTLSDLEKLTGN